MDKEVKLHLTNSIIPFWKNLRDDIFGGYYGFMSQDLLLNREADKGCILANRILWFFSNSYTLLKDKTILEEATHCYDFVKNKCIDSEYGGVFWSVTYDGIPADTMKHTYNQAFAIYALASYYEASGKGEALQRATSIFELIEQRCRDEYGYMEAFDRKFGPISNEALSTNGIIASKTMNTVLHVLEAYTELYRVGHDERVANRLTEILELVKDRVYNRELIRLEVLFDEKYNSLLDLHSYGHDIEASWLMDRAVEVLEAGGKIDASLAAKISKISDALALRIYERAYDGHSVLNECENGVDNVHRVWWIQAESVVGFLNAYGKDRSKAYYKEAADNIWEYIKEYIIDHRAGSEWFWEVDENGVPYNEHAIVEQWKCPYHNGRMCIEVIRRMNKL